MRSINNDPRRLGKTSHFIWANANSFSGSAYHFSSISFIIQDFSNRSAKPKRFFFQNSPIIVLTVLSFVCCGRGYFQRIKPFGDLHRALSCDAPFKDSLYCWANSFIHQKLVLICRIQPIAIESLAAPIHASSIPGFYRTSDLQRKILTVHSVYKVPQRQFHATGRSDVVIAVKRITDRDKPRSKEGKNQFKIRSHLQILTAKAR